MFFDALTLAAACDELRQKVLGGRVQRVLSLSEHSLGCEIYANHERHWLLMSAHPQHARVHLSHERLARGVEVETPLLLLMRKHIRDGRLIAINQPPLERILVLTVAKRADDPAGSLEQCQVIIEAMGRYSNIALVDERGIVLDSLKRVPAQVNRYRVVLPNHPYVAPPPQAKTPPESLAVAELEQALMGRAPETPIWQGLVATVSGMSPLLARETVFRATGNANTVCGAVQGLASLDRLLEVVGTLYAGIREHNWQPSVARESDAVVAFAPYVLTHLGNVERLDSMSTAIDSYFGEVERLTAGGQQRSQIRARLEEVRQRHARRKEALDRQWAQGQEAERLRRSGEAILAAVASIHPGQERLDGDGITVALDPRLSAVENAQAYFREYKKAKGALQLLPEMLAAEEATLAYLDEVRAHLELAATVDEIRRVAADLREAGLGSGPQEKSPKKKSKSQAKRAKPVRRPERTGPPPFRVLAGGFELYVGRSARQNEEITFHTAGPDDLWLHARGVPGAHVVVKGQGREIPEGVLLLAARLAASFSQARGSGRVAVDYTLRKHVRRIRAGLPGLVSYSQERTVDVVPEKTEHVST